MIFFFGSWTFCGSRDAGKSDDQIIDFLSSNATQHVLSADPSKGNKKKRGRDEFEKDEDGKFIVEMPIEEENQPKKKRKGEDGDRYQIIIIIFIAPRIVFLSP